MSARRSRRCLFARAGKQAGVGLRPIADDETVEQQFFQKSLQLERRDSHRGEQSDEIATGHPPTPTRPSSIFRMPNSSSLR